MNIEFFLTTFWQVSSLLFFIVVGYLLGKLKILPDNTPGVLSKLENNVFLPALMLKTFMLNFTIEALSSVGTIFLKSFALELIILPIAWGITCLCTKDAFLRKTYMYSLCFANFGFMGTAFAESFFDPNTFFSYTVFTLVLWIFINLWATPSLLMDHGEGHITIKQRLKSMANPMMIGMLLGAVIGLSGIVIKPGDFVYNVVNSAAACMSPVAMILTGLTIAKARLRIVLKIKGIYIITFIRLILIPVAFLLIAKLFPNDTVFILCALCALAMPLGLNTVVIPSAYGKDTSVASGMALVSHILSLLTIPLMFALHGLLFPA